MTDTVLVARDGAIATVTLNAPEKLNALDLATWTRLGEAIRDLSADESLRCVVIRGAGDKAFAAGADISEFTTVRKNSKASKTYGERVAATMQAVMDCRHPTVAMIRGACVGGGLEVAACCDLRICGESSRFGVPIKKLGLVMAHGELSKLVALVGRAVALEILLEGRVFGAREAMEKGLVSRVVPDAEVEKEAYATAKRIAEGAPLVARWHKKFINRLLDPRPWSETEKDEGFACYDTEDFKEGVKAFLEKRDPAFKGR